MQQEALQAFLGRFVADLGATGAAGGVVVGHRLGLYRSLAEGAATPEQLADRADCHPRYIGEWLRGQAAGGYVDYDPSTGRFSLDEVQAFCLADPNGPNMPAAFLAAVGYLRAEPQLSEAFRTGDGISWGEHSEDVFVGTDAFYRPGYIAELVPTWIPALEGVHERLTDGGRIADKLGTILGVWAHPDDEVYLSGGVMAVARDAGQRVSVVTATRGEHGQAGSGQLTSSELGRLREEELRTAFAILGVDDHRFLGVEDGRCAEQPVQPMVQLLTEIIEQVAPTTILTFGPDGMTGHEDHQVVSSWVTSARSRAAPGAAVMMCGYGRGRFRT
jgi:hypothetical protein